MSCSKELFLDACEHNDLQLVRDMLLARGADPNGRDEEPQLAVNSLQSLSLAQFTLIS